MGPRPGAAYWNQPEVADAIRRAFGMNDAPPTPAAPPTIRPEPASHHKPERAACHPERRVHHRDQCIECYLDARAIKHGKARQDMTIPRAVPGVTQRALNAIPSKCPKCGNQFLEVSESRREVHCPGTRAGCGGTWFLVMR